MLFFSPKNKKKLQCSALKPTFVCMEKQFRQVSTVSLQNSLLQNSSLLSLTFKLIYMNTCCVLRIQSIQTILALVSHEIKLSKRNLGIQLTLLYSLLTDIWNGLSSPNLNWKWEIFKKKKLHIFNMSIDKFFFIQQVLLDKQKNTMSWLI